MKTMRLGVVLVAASVLLGGFAASAGADHNPNDPDYWESRTEHPSTCYYHEASGGSHGRLADSGKAVKLNAFDPSWGTHWELLVVKGGSVDNGYGRGNAVYHHPSAGVNYYPPSNGGGQRPDVSHWIVCKGTVPPTTTTPTTLPPTTTAPSTTAPPTTVVQTTVPPTTQPPTTLPPETTAPTTTVPVTTVPVTTVPVTTTPPTTVVVTTVPPSTAVTTTTPATTVPPTVLDTTVTTAPSTTVAPAVVTNLPRTGSNTATIAWIASALLVLGGIMTMVRRPRSA
jgi:LPXTG-motif cell wall-anchored protein